MTALPRQKSLLFYAAVAFFYCLLLFQDSAVSDPLPENPEEISWHISALSVSFDSTRDLYIARDQVIITGGKTRLEADHVEFSNKTKEAFAKGNVIFISGEDSISCDAMTINLEKETGTIHKGTIFIQKNNLYIYGENIRKTGEFTYSADTGTITSCSGDSPDWKISGKNITVTVEGYGMARDAVFFAKDVPAAYSPFLIFPVKTKRQTGFLMPRVSSSNRKGFGYEQPFFLAVSDHTDATFFVDYMSDRGTKAGTEYRYMLDNKSKGAVFFDYLEDRKIDDGTKRTENYSFSGTPQRTNSDRYWFRMKHDQELPNGFAAKLDLDVVSDADYFHEFQDGFTGFRKTNDSLEDEFGRSLDEYDQTLRKNRLNINKSWAAHTMNIESVWYDNVIARQKGTADTTLQTLPAVQFDAVQQQINGSLFYYSFGSEFRSFYRQDTTQNLVNGQRADFYPKVYLPMRLGKNFYFESSLGARQTLWHAGDYISAGGRSDDFHTRHVADFGAEISTQLIKIFNPDNEFVEKIKHEVVPKLQYTFTPDIGQDDLPYFDTLDRIVKQNLVTWSVTNNFISRKTHLLPGGTQSQTYHDFAYVQLSQSYDINRQRENHSRPFSDFLLTTELNPNGFISLDTDLSWSPYDHEYKTFIIGGIIKDNRGDALTTEYRYNRDLSESLYSRIDIALTKGANLWHKTRENLRRNLYTTVDTHPGLSAYYSFEKNLKDRITIETKAGFTLIRQCWAFDLSVTESREDRSIAFLVNLHGIGGMGIQ